MCTLMIPPVLPGACTGVTYKHRVRKQRKGGLKRDMGTWSTLRRVSRGKDARRSALIEFAKSFEMI